MADVLPSLQVPFHSRFGVEVPFAVPCDSAISRETRHILEF